jgi:hypothetical protein
MSAFNKNQNAPRAMIWIDDRFHIVIRRSPPPPMESAALVIEVYPITDGEIWDHPYDTFVVDEDRIIELEHEMRE